MNNVSPEVKNWLVSKSCPREMKNRYDDGKYIDDKWMEICKFPTELRGHICNSKTLPEIKNISTMDGKYAVDYVYLRGDLEEKVDTLNSLGLKTISPAELIYIMKGRKLSDKFPSQTHTRVSVLHDPEQKNVYLDSSGFILDRYYKEMYQSEFERKPFFIPESDKKYLVEHLETLVSKVTAFIIDESKIIQEYYQGLGGIKLKSRPVYWELDEFKKFDFDRYFTAYDTKCSYNQFRRDIIQFLFTETSLEIGPQFYFRFLELNREGQFWINLLPEQAPRIDKAYISSMFTFGWQLRAHGLTDWGFLDTNEKSSDYPGDDWCKIQ